VRTSIGESVGESIGELRFDDQVAAVADSHSVTSPEGGTAIIDSALRAWGRVDIVINNAGIVRDAPFQDMTPDRFEPCWMCT
jgi:NAD(P)-dependent dehydrogenase (short-subunit alcohol dehydrogenase family)